MQICLTTFGSFGDLHPVLGLADALQARGHSTVIATSPVYRDIAEAIEMVMGAPRARAAG